MSDTVDPFNPRMRRIAPADLPYQNQTKNVTPSLEPSSPSSSAPLGHAAQARCPACDGAGWYVEAVPYGHPNFGKPLPCSCTLSTRRAAADAQALSRLGDELGSLSDKTFSSFDLLRPLIPLYEKNGVYYHDLARVPMPERKGINVISIEAQQSALHAAYAAAECYAQQWGGWLVLYGAYGAGKSHLAAAVAHAGVGLGLRTRYRSLPGLFDALKAGFDNGTSEPIFEDVISSDLLILDDLFDSDLVNEWRKSRLFRLFNEREQKATIITSNRRMDDLVPASDVDAGRLLSRIAGNAQQIWLPISDYRRLKKERAA